MKINVPKVHAVITVVAAVSIALTFILQIVNIAFAMVMTPDFMIGTASVTLTMLAVTSTTISFLISLYRMANK
jgi:hypothetical protein